MPLLLNSFLERPVCRPSRLAVLERLIDAHPGAPWTVGEMARRIGISPSRLHALSRSEWGLSPQAWLAERRIGHVRKWLAESDLPIADLALRARVRRSKRAHPRHAALTGLTPAAYRRQTRLEQKNRSPEQDSRTARDIVRSGMRTRRPLRPRQSPLHKERTMSALNVTIDPSIKGAWPEARLGCFIYTADVRAAKTLSGPASKT